MAANEAFRRAAGDLADDRCEGERGTDVAVDRDPIAMSPPDRTISGTKYIGVSGTAYGKGLPRGPPVASGQLTSMDGTTQLTVMTGCGPIRGPPPTITVATITVRNVATGVMGCLSDTGSQQLWVMEGTAEGLVDSWG
jgi:hypothetical protein